MIIDQNKLPFLSSNTKQFVFLKNTEKIPNSMDLLELSPKLNYNESQSSVKHATCQICNNIATNPKMCEECEILYCGNCSSLLLTPNKENKLTCKNCPELLNLKPLSKSLQRIIEDFQLRCPSLNENCCNPIKYKNLISHLDGCKYWDGFSKCLGCGLIGKANEIEDHVSVCPFVYFKCEFCNNVVKRKDLDLHQEGCRKIFPSCELCKVLKTRMDDLEEKLFIKVNSMENIIDFQQKSIFKFNQNINCFLFFLYKIFYN